MDTNWVLLGGKLFKRGYLPHKVYEKAGGGYYAKSGFDLHGPYTSSKEAVQACDLLDQQLLNLKPVED